MFVHRDLVRFGNYYMGNLCSLIWTTTAKYGTGDSCLREADYIFPGSSWAQKYPASNYK